VSVWITCTPPTPNGPLHVGHMAGPYIAADVLRRSLASADEPVRLTTGMDDNQTYVPRRAWGDGVGGAAVAEQFTASITETWRTAGVEFDEIVLPHGADYEARVQAMFSALVESNTVVSRDTTLPHCTTCDRWLYEAYLDGRCPHCGAVTNGNACEQCCRPNACRDVVDPSCIRCSERPTLRSVTLLVLPLEPLRDKLVEYWNGVDMPPRLRAVCDEMAADALPEILVAHPGDWGVPVPVSGFEDHRIYVWLEMAEGYAAQRPTDLSAGEGRLVQFFGIDNGYFHAVLMPAANIALGRHELLAERFVVNEFYLYNGAKFSTSRKHAVWAADVLPVAGADMLRLHAMLHRPATSQTDFTLRDLAETEAVLDLWNRTFVAILELDSDDTHEQDVDAAAGADLERHARLIDRAALDAELALGERDFDASAAAAALVGLTARIGHLVDEVQAAKHQAARGAAGRRLARDAARRFVEVATPIVPGGAGRLRDALSAGAPPRVKLFGMGA